MTSGVMTPWNHSACANRDWQQPRRLAAARTAVHVAAGVALAGVALLSGRARLGLGGLDLGHRSGGLLVRRQARQARAQRLQQVLQPQRPYCSGDHRVSQGIIAHNGLAPEARQPPAQRLQQVLQPKRPCRFADRRVAMG